MKRLTIIILLGMKIQMMQAQSKYEIHIDTINKIDNSGLKYGIWNEYWGTGNLFNQYNYINGKKEGAYLFYERNGQLSSVGFLKNGKEVGWTFEFRDDKLWRSRCLIESTGYASINDHFDNQLPKTGGNYSAGCGQLVEYFENGTVKGITSYLNSKLEGYFSEYFLNGQLKVHGINKLNMPWSIFSSFDSLGNSVDIGNLLNGSGTFKKYYFNKKLKKIEEYSNGKYWNTIYYYSITGDSLNKGSIRDGTGDILEYFDTGNIKSKTSFKGGIRNGIYIEYNEKGIKIISGNYLDGYEEGDWELFDERGKLMAVYEYKHGNFISISDFEH